MRGFGRIWGLFLFVLVGVFPFGVSAMADDDLLTAEEWAYVESLPTLRVGAIEGAAPLTYVDDGGEIKGISVVVMDEIAERLGLDVVYEANDSIADILSNNYDMALNGASNYMIKPGVFLSDPYLKTELFLVYNRGHGLETLVEKKVGVVSGGNIPESAPAENVLFYDTRKDVLDAVNRGEVDYAYANSHSVAFYSFQEYYENIQYTPTNEPDREYSFVIAEKHEALVPILNKALASIEEGRMNSIILEVLADSNRPFMLKVFIREYLAVIVFIFVFLIGYFIYMNRRLRRSLVENKRNAREIQRLSYRDSLTDLYNRRFAEERFVEINRELAYPVSIIIGDLNYLKETNDQFGHKYGDQLLIDAADVLRKACRHGDMVARYGGDEFLILLRDISPKDVEQVIERIHQNIKERNKKKPELSSLSIALGYAHKSSVKQPLEEVVAEADCFMYRNKEEMKKQDR